MDYQIFERGSEPNTIIVNFSKLFNEDLDFLSVFHLHKKKLYSNIMDFIISNNNDLMRYDTDRVMITKYLTMKYRINKKIYDHMNQFRDTLYDFIVDDELIDAIRNYVNANYISHIKEKNTNEKFNKGLEFTDEHCKILYSISCAMKYIIPLVAEFIYYYPEYQPNTSEYLCKVFDPLFDIFAKDINIINKLIESVRFRVASTHYSNKKIWAYYEIIGLNSEYLIDLLTRKIIHDLIPKYQFDRNIIAFNHVAINKNIQFFFQFNLPYAFKPVNNTRRDNGLSDFDKLMIKTARVNESETICREVNIRNTIKRLYHKYKIVPTRDEIEFYSGCDINKLQRTFIFLFFSKDFGSYDVLYGCDFKTYIKLMILLKKILRQLNFSYLSRLISSRIEPSLDRRILSKKNILKIVDNYKYNYLLTNKFNFASHNIIASEIILKHLSILLNNRFLEYEYPDKRGDTYIDYTETEIIDEYLSFLEII